MGCSHHILKVGVPVEMIIICHICGEKVDREYPFNGHECCYGSTGYDLDVDIIITNTIER
jgi:hypothetical protein